MAAMNFQKIVVPLAGLLLLFTAWRSYGWMGVACAVSAIVLFVLVHFNRTMAVLRRAANQPLGYVDSAVMLNAKLKPRMTLLHVVAMTRSIGELRSPKDAQPEVYRWSDAGHSWVDATFADGKLLQWQLTRPSAAGDGDADAAADTPQD